MGPTLWFISLYLIAGLDIADLVHDKKYLIIVIIVELFLIVCTHLTHANNAIFYMTILTYGLYVGSFVSSFFMRKSVTVCKTVEFVATIFTMGILVEFLEDILVKDYTRYQTAFMRTPSIIFGLGGGNAVKIIVFCLLAPAV